MMIVLWMWARDDRASLGGWLEAARRSNFEELVGGPARTAAPEPGDARRPGAPGQSEPAPASQGAIDDDEHLAAYNEYLARLNTAPEPGRRQP
jgi:hypothetical protein